MVRRSLSQYNTTLAPYAKAAKCQEWIASCDEGVFDKIAATRKRESGTIQGKAATWRAGAKRKREEEDDDDDDDDDDDE